MIYLDTSVALAHLLAEDRHPPDELWAGPIVSSRLLAFELWTRVHGRGLGATHGEAARELLGRIAFLEMIPEVVGRAFEPFPVEVRTLDALHLASCLFLRAQRQRVELATYDARMQSAAARLEIPIFRLA